MTDSALLIKFETYIEGMKKLDFVALTRAVLDCIQSYDEETKVIREVQRIMSDEDDSDRARKLHAVDTRPMYIFDRETIELIDYDVPFLVHSWFL